MLSHYELCRIIVVVTPGNEFPGIFESRERSKIKTFQSRDISISI
jgi:hypothetical protein